MELAHLSPTPLGHFTGQITTLAYSGPICLMPTSPETFDLLTHDEAGIITTIGAVAERYDPDTGEIFHAGYLDMPGFASPQGITVAPLADGSVHLSWTRSAVQLPDCPSITTAAHDHDDELPPLPANSRSTDTVCDELDDLPPLPCPAKGRRRDDDASMFWKEHPHAHRPHRTAHSRRDPTNT